MNKYIIKAINSSNRFKMECYDKVQKIAIMRGKPVVIAQRRWMCDISWDPSANCFLCVNRSTSSLVITNP